MKHRILCLFLCCVLTGVQSSTQAQELLTLEEAIRLTLQNNYNIRLVANTLESNKNNVTYGQAGALPYIGGTLTNNNSILDSRQVQANGVVTERTGARNMNLNYGVGLTWTIFDGFGMFARYDQLQELEKMGEENLQLTILTNVAAVTNTYYNLVQQQKQLKAYDTAIVISQMRLQLAQNRFEIGKAARLEVLNAQVDMNTDTTNLLLQEQLYHNTQTYLNQLMARDLSSRFTVTDSITVDNTLTLDLLSDQALQQNPSLKAAAINRRVAELNLRIIKANRYPVVNLNTGYNFTNTQSALGFATQTSGKGLTYGVTASVPIFNGFTQHTNERNAHLVISNAELQYEQINQTILAQLTTAYETYMTSYKLMMLEEKNLGIAKQNMDITFDKLQLGSITTIELRTAQLNYINATVQYANAQYNAKVAEISLKQLSGTMEF